MTFIRTRNLEELQHLTYEAFTDPRVGDVFHEMYSYFVEVVKVTPTHVFWQSRHQPYVPRGKCTREEWKTKFTYKTPKLSHKYTMLIIERGLKPKVWVKYMEYDPRFPGHRMWVSGCEGCDLGTFRYHHWAAALGSALEHYHLGCNLSRERAIDRGIKYSKVVRSPMTSMKDLSCGVHQHLGGQL